MKKTYQNYTSAPYVRTRLAAGDLMYIVVLALLPCAGVGIYHYGFHAALLVGISVGTAIVAEFFCDLIRRRGSSVWDFSCVVTGLIGGLLLPPAVPLWYPALLSALAIIVFKHLFGGIGRNLLNPAMAAKCVLLVAFYDVMCDYGNFQHTQEPPLSLLESGQTPALFDMLTGNTAGCIGTSSALAVLLGAVILLLAGIIDLYIPVAAIASFMLCYLIAGEYGLSAYTQFIQICGGGFLFTVFFMAQDYTTSPIAKSARIVYGVLLGILVFVFRQVGLLEEACVPALLIVNVLRPLLDRKIAPKPFGATASRWVVREPRRRRRARPEPSKEEILSNEQLDAEFERFEAQIERQTRGLETARYTGDDTLLRQAQAEAYETLREKPHRKEEPRDVQGDLYAGIGVGVPGEFEAVMTDTSAINPAAIEAALEDGEESFPGEEVVRDTDMWEVAEIIRAEREARRESEQDFANLQFADLTPDGTQENPQ